MLDLPTPLARSGHLDSAVTHNRIAYDKVYHYEYGFVRPFSFYAELFNLPDNDQIRLVLQSFRT